DPFFRFGYCHGMPAPYPFDVARATETARLAARAAAAAAMRHWRRLDAVETKADGSPVTVADREAEEAAVSVIRAAFPEHDAPGEEGGLREPRRSGPTRSSRWIVDPLDGTMGFSRGGIM